MELFKIAIGNMRWNVEDSLPGRRRQEVGSSKKEAGIENMKDIEPGYRVEIDKIQKDLWHNLLLQFDDASFYQTWSYGEIHSGKNRISHLVLKKSAKVVGMAQVWIYRIPLLRVGTAYVNWGPMWRVKGEATDIGHLRNMLRGLYNEYVIRRGYLLKILPKVIGDQQNNALKELYVKEGFSCSEDPLQTVVLDLSVSLEELRRNLSRSWRRSLAAAEEQQLDIIEGNDEDVCQMVRKIANEMKDRKKYFGGDQDELIAANKVLPDGLKLRMMVCTFNKEPIAALGWPTVGKIGMPLVGGTGNKALESKASFLLWWKMIQYYKLNGFRGLDAGGVNEERNPGGYLFKTGLVGKRFKEPSQFIGQFDACKNPLSMFIFKGVYFLRDRYRDMRRKSAKWRKRGNNE